MQIFGSTYPAVVTVVKMFRKVSEMLEKHPAECQLLPLTSPNQQTGAKHEEMLAPLSVNESKHCGWKRNELNLICGIQTKVVCMIHFRPGPRKERRSTARK